MDFLISIQRNNPHGEIAIYEQSFNSLVDDEKNVIQYNRRKMSDLVYRYENELSRFLILGDLIIPQQYHGREEVYIKNICDNYNFNILRSLNGFFYLIRMNKDQQNIEVFNSLFSILPIYYYQNEKQIIISSRIEFIGKKLKKHASINKKFILEKLLFNYPLFNETLFKEISLLPGNYFLRLFGGKIDFVQHTNVSDFFVDSPRSWKKSLDSMCDLFLGVVNEYFPDDIFAISLTGGFDGRTLVAAALAQKKNFESYAFGSPDSNDVHIPLAISQALDFRFTPIWLDESYINNHFLKHGIDFLFYSEGYGNIGRSHYLYAMQELQRRNKYIITGNFGSELFRAIHVRGVVTTDLLIAIFAERKNVELIEKIKNSSQLKLLNMSHFENILKELIDEIINYREQFGNHFSLNHLFYKYIFEETFRKYFGSEIVSESFYVQNRTPYLNFRFIEEFLKSELAGVNNSFMEDNPIKRFRGQILYSYIINKIYPALASWKTGRGYAPKDLLSIPGKLRVAKSYFSKMFRDNNSKIDPFSVQRSLTYHSDTITSWLKFSDLFNVGYVREMIQKSGWVEMQNDLVNVVSLSRFLYEKLDSKITSEPI